MVKLADPYFVGNYHHDNNSSDEQYYGDHRDHPFSNGEAISPMPPTPASSGRLYPETNEFPPPPGQFYDQSDATQPHFQAAQASEQPPYNPAAYASLAPTRPQAEAYNPAEYASGMAGQPPQDYFQPLPQQYEYQAEQAENPQDYHPGYEPEMQQEPTTYLDYGGLQEGHQSQPGYQAEPLPYQQPMGPISANTYEHARGGDGNGDGDGDGSRDRGIVDSRDDDDGEENHRHNDDEVSALRFSEGYNRGA